MGTLALLGYFFMEIYYSYGPRIIDGVNIDQDINASIPVKLADQGIDEPVTDLTGLGYEPGQRNLDGSPL